MPFISSDRKEVNNFLTTNKHCSKGLNGKGSKCNYGTVESNTIDQYGKIETIKPSVNSTTKFYKMENPSNLTSSDNENNFSNNNVTILKNQPYDESIEITGEALLEPLSNMEDKAAEETEEEDKIGDESLLNKSGIPRPTSRPISRPPSRPAPSARVRALGKDELEEVDQNSAEDEEDEDEEEEDEEQGIQVEGYFPSTFAAHPESAKYRPVTARERLTVSQMYQTRFVTRGSGIVREGAVSPDITAETISLSDECSIAEELILSDSPCCFLEEQRDRFYAQLPYKHDRAYDPSDFEHLSVSNDLKELFQFITRYTPQTIELDHKLRPFIPEFIPAVGDIDAFIKVPRPDGQADKLGLHVLDEPCAKQSDPTVLDLQLRAISKETTYKAMVVKSLEKADKRPKEIDSWVNSIGNLHRSKPPPTVHYSRNMPDIEILMQEWPPEFEELLKEVGLPSADLDCSLEEYVDIICGLLDIPVHRSKVQSLHVLFTLYSEFKNSQHFKSLAMDNQLDNTVKSQSQDEQTDHLVLRN